MMKTLGQDVLSRIGKLPLFQELDAEQLTSIAANAREVQISKGEMLFQKGDEAKGFYLVLKGQIKLAKKAASEEQLFDVALGAGAEDIAYICAEHPVP